VTGRRARDAHGDRDALSTLGSIKPRRLTCAGVAVLLVFGYCASGNAQEDQVRDAVAAKFPDGRRRCLRLSTDVVGLHVPQANGGTLFYPSTGPTSPTRHPFVFYAALDADPVPDLVADLAGRGLLKRSVVEATVDTEVGSVGPEVRYGQNGMFVSHPTVYRHTLRRFPVAIYEAAAASPDFGYEVRTPMLYVAPNLPSRLYDGPPPPADMHYSVPTTEPYAISVVAAACLKEQVEAVSNVRPFATPFGLGGPMLQADLTLSPEPPAWMLTPAFSRAALGPNTAPINKPRTVTVLLRQDGGRLTYVEEREQ